MRENKNQPNLRRMIPKDVSGLCFQLGLKVVFRKKKKNFWAPYWSDDCFPKGHAWQNTANHIPLIISPAISSGPSYLPHHAYHHWCITGGLLDLQEFLQVSVPCVCGLGAEEGRHRRKGLQCRGHWLVVLGVELSKKVYSTGVLSFMLTWIKAAFWM